MVIVFPLAAEASAKLAVGVPETEKTSLFAKTLYAAVPVKVAVVNRS